MFNDVFVVDSAPDPFNTLSPYEYMDESGISWVTGKTSSKARGGYEARRGSCRDTMLGMHTEHAYACRE